MNGVVTTTGVADQVGHPAKAARGAPLFVWGTWGLAFLMTLAYVGSYGHETPLGDDYALVPYASGNAPVTVRWLWEPFNGHRIPFPKLLMLGLLRLSRADFRVGMYFDALALGALAGMMIVAARRVRGRTSYADAFFPFILFQLGHSFLLLNFFGVHFISSIVLSGILLLLVVQADELFKFRRALVAAVCLILLTLCGIQGLILAAPLALWLIHSAARHWRSGSHDHVATLVIVAAGLSVLVLLYPLANSDVAGPASVPSFRALVRTSLQFLSTSMGHEAKALWPLPAFAIAGLWLASAVVVVAAWWTRPAERFRALGFVALLMGFFLLALGIGWGRAVGWGYEAGFATHYGILMALSLCCIFFIFELYSPRRITPWVQLGFFVLSSLLFLVNVAPGLQYGRYVDRNMAAFERDLRAREPCFVLAGRHARFLHGWDQAEFADGLWQLHQAGIGLFRDMLDNPPFTEIPLAVKPAMTSPGRDDGSPYLQFTLPKPRNVAGLRLHFSSGVGTGVWSGLHVFWKRPDQSGFSDFPELPHAAAWLPDSGQPETVTVWVGEVISSFRVRCGGGLNGSRIPKIVLLVPPPGGARHGAGGVDRDTQSP